jgi:uncharacterized protein (DUF433 family)
MIVEHPHVELSSEGSPIVRGSKIPVRRLWGWFQKGIAIETLIKRYPTLGAARVLDALAFCFGNQELIEADIAQERAALAHAPCGWRGCTICRQMSLPWSGRAQQNAAQRAAGAVGACGAPSAGAGTAASAPAEGPRRRRPRGEH